MAAQRLCSIEGCGKKHYCRSYCRAHYSRFQKHGDPTSGRIPRGSTAAWLEAHVSYDGEDCLPWPFARAGNGYAKIRVNKKDTWAHRVMCTMAHGDPPSEDHHAAHSCGNGHEACCNPKHLRWATAKENFADMLEHGTYPRGENSGTAKLTDDKVRMIRRSRKSLSELAKELNVTKQCVAAVRTGKTWKHVA